MATSPPRGSTAGSSPLAFTQRTLHGPLGDIQAACAELAAMDIVRTHAVAALLQRMMLGYYVDIRRQTKASLNVAIATGLLGVALFVTGVAAPNLTGMRNSGQVPYWLIAAAVVEVIAVICFLSYSRASRRLGVFHLGLERTNRFILADALCQQLDEYQKNGARMRLVDVVAQASMLTIDGVTQRGAEVAQEGPEHPHPAPVSPAASNLV